MTEADIKKIVRKQLEKENYLVWYPARSRFAPKFKYCTKTNSAKDIFTIYDCLAWKGNQVRYIQYTSHKNRLARVKKIKMFYLLNNVSLPAEVWGIKQDKSIEIIHI